MIIEYEELKVAVAQFLDFIATDSRPYMIEVSDPDDANTYSLAELTESMCDAIDVLMEALDADDSETNDTEY